MKLKRLFIFLVVVLMAVTITGCSNDSNEFVSLTIWTYYNGDTEASFQDIVNTYNTTQGKERKIVVSSISQGAAVNKLYEALKNSALDKAGSDSMPDMFISYADCAYELDGYGKVASLDEYFSEKELENFNEGFLNEGRFGRDQSLKILPISKSTEALYINQTDFDKFLAAYPDCGVGYNDLSTIEGLIKVSEVYYKKTGKAFFGRDSLDNYFVIGAKQLGIDIFRYKDDDSFEINFDENVFKKLWDSYYIPYVKGYFSAIGKFRSSDIQAGEILSYIGSTTSGGYFPKNVIVKNGETTEQYEITSKILETPVFEGGKKYAVSQGAGFCVTKSTSKREKACVDFLKWLCKKENIMEFASTSGYFPATKDGFSNEFIELQSNESYKKNFEVCKNTLDNYGMYTNTVGPKSPQYRDFLKNSLDEICKEARKDIERYSGVEREEAIQYYTDNERFNEWFKSLKNSVLDV